MKYAIIILLLVSLAGCGRSTPTNYYLLESATRAAQMEQMPEKTLRIAQVSTADYLNRNNIVSRIPNHTRLILAEFHLWVEPVSNGVRRVISEVLTPAMLHNGITVLPFGSEERGDYVLLLDVQRLDGNFNDTAVLECYWTLLDNKDQPLTRGIYSSEEMVKGADYDVLVNAESILLARMGQHLAEKLPAFLNKR